MTGNYPTGLYQDQENYPYEQFTFDCGNKQRGSHYGAGIDSHLTVPDELINNDFWQWSWLILFTFLVSGGGWLVGYLVYTPMSGILTSYNFMVVIYSTFIMLFEYPNRLDFGEYLLYPIRRWFIQNLIVLFGYFWLSIPGISVFVMPLLGLWYVSDFLDY
jgi:hypothetical protein